MNLLLVYPKPTQESPQRTPPLSILYLGAYATRRGITVTYFDERWDTDFNEKLQQADVVGVSSMSGYQLKGALKYLKLAHLAGKITIMGGVHCTIAPTSCITEPYVDYLVIGEGEETLVSLLNNINTPENVLGVWLKTKEHPNGLYTGARREIPADQIESPVDMQTLLYFKLSSPTDDIALPASRGCPYNCGFCINSTKKIKKWRALPLSKWTADIDFILSNGIPITFFQMGDDWIGPEKRIVEIAKILQKRNIGWHPSLRITQVNENLASILVAAGCKGVSVGIESGDPDILKYIDKQITIPDIINGATILAKYNIRPFYFFIVGLPGETEQQMHKTMDIADKLYKIHSHNCSIVFYGFNPQQGTRLYEDALTHNFPVPRTLLEWASHTRSTTHNPLVNAIYHIAGLNFHRNKGDKTDRNFPGIRRLLILPFEIICVFRWKHRMFKWFIFEQTIIRFIINNLRIKRGMDI